jgi:hypothetical protein
MWRVKGPSTGRGNVWLWPEKLMLDSGTLEIGLGKSHPSDSRSSSGNQSGSVRS